LCLLWASRWEHDKGPETFFAALRILRDRGINFHLNVLGESFGQVPSCFEAARQEFSGHIRRWGFLTDRAEYQAALSASDVAVSTANHEFFGIAMVEAVAAGCFPLAPCRLAYPEVLGTASDWFHDGTAEDLARRLIELDGRLSNQGQLWMGEDRSREMIDRFGWDNAATDLDKALVRLISSSS
jgi:glycosyltransferase involved in cell wall biosynthesis